MCTNHFCYCDKSGIVSNNVEKVLFLVVETLSQTIADIYPPGFLTYPAGTFWVDDFLKSEFVWSFPGE